jgi:N-methylhydantoinase B
VESLEMAYPIRVRRYSLRDGSGGKGRYRGGDGIVREYEFLTPATVTINSERRRKAPYGLQGGKAAAMGRNIVIRKQGKAQDVSGKYSTQVQPGDRIRIETPGGGGWGSS